MQIVDGGIMIYEISAKDLKEHGDEICDQIFCELTYEWWDIYV